ncbi:MAG TPA: SRPBCC family protein [Gemmatimonadales bacterium]|nr:SRPBCC family protein [Gemmatimonadales bacterium]
MKWVLIVLGAVLGLVALMTLIGAFVPRDHRATSTITLHQAPDSVWKVIRDFGGIPAWWPAIKESVRQPDKDGHEVWRQKMSGWDVPLIVIESTPGRRLVTQIDTSGGGAFGGTWTYELVPDSGGATKISVTEAGWIGNPIFRFLSRFVFGYYGSLDGYLKALGKHFGETVQPAHS